MVNIYKLVEPTTLEVRYVGKTKKTLKKRMCTHIFNKGNKAKVNKWIRKLIREDKKPLIELIERCPTEIWQEREKYWIAFYRNKNCNLMNITDGGNVGALGYKHTEEAKRRIGLMNSRPKSKEWIANATREMIKSVATPIVQFTKDGEFIKRWDSFCFAAKEIHPDNYKAAIKNIHACCNKKRKSAYGFSWKYVSETIDSYNEGE